MKVRDNGPLKVTGPVRIVDSEGGLIEETTGRPIVLCRCGHSLNKPWCDATHRSAGFESCVRADS
ncbi:MAG: CDGSH iron-sulfur domain-containing protein [Solirubrobacterales bacterium]|nr:CDGSH iron-sulfur domain-containing protein [Solirubrobacterales bacterium]